MIMAKHSDPNIYPKGWDAARVKRVAAYYDSQSPEAAAAEDDAAFGGDATALMVVPIALVGEVTKLIARHAMPSRKPHARASKRKSA